MKNGKNRLHGNRAQRRPKVLALAFFNRSTLAVARDLIGKYLVRRHRGRSLAFMVTEVEAYDGPRDLASHASRGRTPRTTIMFGPAGRFYVYFTYGMHWLVNVVTGPKEYPAAVLIRAGRYLDVKTGKEVAVSGPARVTRFLHIDGKQNGLTAEKKNSLWFEDRGGTIASKKIVKSKRVGVDYAGPIWANKLYNFKL